jgi:hypothetical protein
MKVLETGLGADEEKERYLRVHYWWAVNDFVRLDENAQIPSRYVRKFHENLAKLFVLLDERDPKDRIMKAEIARERRDFAQAERLQSDLPENFVWVVDKMLELSKE